jgi:hypothetical protein
VKKSRERRSSRECLYCGHVIDDARPLYLVALVGGSVVGPFHPFCSAKVIARQKASEGKALPPGMEFGRIVPGVTQEELL